MIRSVRKSAVLLLVVVGIFLSLPTQANAQRWLQTSQLFVTDLGSGSTPSVLLDTLAQVLERRDSIMVKRSPDGQEMLLSDLKNELINGPGIGLSSGANGVFIDYRFEIENRGFKESIEGFQYVFRPPGGRGEDIQLLYVDATDKWVQDILRNKGTTLTTNQAALKTFSDQLAFARMAEKGQVVEIANQVVREGYERQKRQLVQKIQRLTYGSM